MFGRSKSTQPVAEPQATDLITEPAAGGKGHPTPKRREAEARNRRPLVEGTALPANATKEQRREAKRARREQAARERQQQRQALMSGEEGHLPVRDRGPAKRWVRNYVDARRSVGEYFLPGSLAVLGLSLVNNTTIKGLSVALLYSLLIAVLIDSFMLRRKLRRETELRFGEKAQGAAGYGMMRALQFRRFRMPKPQVSRGEFPA